MTSRPLTLAKIFEEHVGKVSDKWSIYITEYDRLFEAYRDRPVCLLEIGIQNGGSLEIWGKFFTNAHKLIGCDINPDCAQLQFDDPRIAVVIANANVDETQQHLLNLSPEFDLIIDDGSHHSGDIVRSFARYFPHLNDGGLYIAEDLHCSYWQDFEGGLFQPYSSIAFFKQLADTINHEHWGVDKTRSELLRSFNRQYNTLLDEVSLAHIHSIEFINSMCVIRKAVPADNVLGHRFVAGTIALLDEAPLSLHGSSSPHPNQSENQWATKDAPEDELASQLQKIASLNQAVSERDGEIQNINQAIAEHEQAYLAQLAQARQKIETHLIELVAREKAYSQQLQEIHQRADAERTELSRQHQAHLQEIKRQQAEHEWLTAERIHTLNQELHRLLADNATREQEIAAQLLTIQQQTEQEKTEQGRQHAEREQAHLAQLALARQQLETQLLELANREKAYAQQLQDIQQAHEQQKTEQNRQHAEREQALNAQLHAKQDELHNLTHHWTETEKAQAQALAQLHHELNAMRATNSWQWTAPLRNLATLLGGKDLDSDKALPSTTKEPSPNEPHDTVDTHNSSPTAPTHSLQTPLLSADNGIVNMPMNQTSAITTLDDLLSHHDESFIHCAYHTLLRRAPDPEGLRYYLLRVRAGISKVEILAQLYLSTEGKSRKVKIAGLDEAIRRHQLLKTPLLGALLRLTGVKQIEENFSQVQQQKAAVKLESAAQSCCSHTEGATIVSLPTGWPAVAADAHQVAEMITCLEERSYGQFIKGGGFKKGARNRHPYRMLAAGEKVEQYFVQSEAILSSLTLYFYTYMKENGARVRVNIYVVLPELTEHCLATEYFEGNDIIDCAAVHLWLEPAISAAAGQIFRIEIIIDALDEAAHITVALSESNDDTLCTFDIGGPSKYALSFGVNQAPTLNAKKYFAFVSGCPGDAFRYRCIHIGEALSRLGYGVDVFQPGEEVWNTLIENYQVVVLHRVPYGLSVANFLESARKAHVLTIFDTDDLVFNPKLANQIDAYNAMSAPEKEVYLDGLVRYNKTLSECDLVTVTTERLKQEVLRLWPGKSVEIIRNRVSKEMCDLAEDALRIPKPESQNVIIAYFSGSKTHRKDFMTCESAVLKILEKHRNARLLIVGHLEVPDTFAKVADQIDTIPFVAWQALAEVYRKMDINLAPLEYDTAFTESKSELKFLEAALLSVPTVAANMGAYAITVENGVDGILCHSTEEWFSGLERLVLDPSLRKQVGQAAREKVSQSSLTFRNGSAIQAKYHRLFNSAECLEYHRKPTVAFILRAPIAKTGGGYKKIFILANYIKKNFNVTVYVEAIAHLSKMTDEEICLYCEEYFNFDHRDVRVGHEKIEAADIVVATNWPTAPTVESLNNARLKCYFVQDYEPSFYKEEELSYELASKTYDLGLSVITIGDYLKNELASRGGWCRSIPFAIDPAFLNADSKQEFSSNKPCSILFFARPAIPRRNFQAGVDALERVSKAYPKIKISLYGLDEYIDLPFKYENLGLVPQNELALIMGKTDIHLSYSLTNISTVIYEAMACGCACVEADVEPVRVMVKDGQHCLLAEPTGLGTFRTLSSLIDSPKQRKKLSVNGRAFAKTLNEENMCKRFQCHLEEAWMLK